MVNYTDKLEKIKNVWYYKIKFSDNPFTMTKKDIDLFKILETKSILYNRIIAFNTGKSNILKTSDLNFEYKKL